MPFKAVIAIVANAKDIPQELMPFINYKAGLDGRVVNETDMVAVLQIENIESYFPVFIDGKTTLAGVEAELIKIDVTLSNDARSKLEELLAHP